jgi:hypothetical protein
MNADAAPLAPLTAAQMQALVERPEDVLGALDNTQLRLLAERADRALEVRVTAALPGLIRDAVRTVLADTTAPAPVSAALVTYDDGAYFWDENDVVVTFADGGELALKLAGHTAMVEALVMYAEWDEPHETSVLRVTFEPAGLAAEH